MAYKINSKRASCMARSFYILTRKSLIISAFILAGMLMPAQGQDTIKYSNPSWWFGAAAGANFNFYRGSTQELNSTFSVPAVFHNGFGIGLFAAPLVEYYRPGTMLGFMLQAGYDSRKGAWDQIKTPCNCPADLKTDLNYVTFEPSLRFAPFKSSFYLYAGPRLAYNLAKSFTYSQKTNPDIPEQVAEPDVTGDFSNINNLLLSMQVGAGIDIPLSSELKKTKWMLSPFISYHPYFGQDPRSIETWNITTIRAGVALKLGRGKEIPKPPKVEEPMVAIVLEPVVKFSLEAPSNVPVNHNVKEIFPLRNYIFFKKGSTRIPDRYILLTKDQVKDFKEDQLQDLEPNKIPSRSERQMIVYHNVMNILGNRISKNPSATVKLVGSSALGPQDGKKMAESVKAYLVDIFGIDPSRIAVEGLTKPRIPSEKPGGTRELELLREGDQRVSIESGSLDILTEFQTGIDGPLRPVDIFSKLEVPNEGVVKFKTEGATEAFTSWSLDITDRNGIVKNFGPYTQEQISVPARLILSTPDVADFKVTMVGQSKTGKVVKQDSNLHLDTRALPVPDELTRFSIIYEFDIADAINVYEQYLLDIIVPKIPKNGKVIISGYTDIIGEEEHNLRLSLGRANDVKNILEKGLLNAGRSDVTFEVYAYGEDPAKAPFNNKLPEERFYNRTVIIDLLPNK
jgi:outer membrane protein OmpA-like peptidoglycan-associated protein